MDTASRWCGLPHRPGAVCDSWLRSLRDSARGNLVAANGRLTHALIDLGDRGVGLADVILKSLGEQVLILVLVSFRAERLCDQC